MPKAIILILKSGFSNRMFPLITTYNYCKTNNIKLLVVWTANTCRSCMSHYNKKHHVLSYYYKTIPLNIEIFNTLNDILIKYSITKPHRINMNYSNRIPDLMNHDYVLIDNVCHPLFYENHTDASIFAPYPKTNNKLINNAIIHCLSNIIIEFKLTDELQDIINNYNSFDIGMHIRVTDGGFRNYNKQKMITNVCELINKNVQSKIFLCTDDKDTATYFEKRYPNVVQYYNDDKYINNDIGTYYGLVDMYLLSRCTKIYGTPGSSFSLLAYTINYNYDKTIDFLIK